MKRFERKGAFYAACMAVLAVTALVSWVFGKRVEEPNICSLEFREVYLETHDSDAELARECPYEPWYRNRGDRPQD
jgi:hypothetical protein